MAKHTARTPRPVRRRRPPPSVTSPLPVEPETVTPAPTVDALRAMTEGIDVPLAVELERALEKAIGAFETEHGALVRKACDVPDSHMDLRDVVWCTFLGHVLQRIEQQKGRAQVERLVGALLDQFVAARGEIAKLMGTLQ